MIRKNRRNSDCVKFDEGAIRNICSNPKAEPFWVADMDFESPKAVNDALKKASKLGLYGYSMNSGTRRIAHDFILERHGLDLPEAQIVPSRGVLFSLAMLAEQQKGSIIVNMPAYKPFVSICELQGHRICPWHLGYDRENHRFFLDIPELERLCSSGECSMLIFCSPHNPIGQVYTEDELLQVASICHKYGVKVVSDEIHSDLVFPGTTQFPFAAVSKKAGLESITLMAPSKTFNLAGEHFSLTLFTDPAEAKAFEERMNQVFASGPSYLDNLMACAAYQHGGEWLDDCVATLKSNAEFLDAFCTERIPQLHVVMPHGSFICFIDCSEILEAAKKDQAENPRLYKVDSSPEGGTLSRFFGVRCKVAVHDGTWFGSEYEGFVRFNYATDQKHIENALLRMEAGVKKLLQ